MIETPLVTIAIPFYNTERFLADAIQSVINQTYSNWELILVDDGSVDRSKEIAETYSRRDKRIKVISDGCNKGLPTRLNETIMLARGVYYARMDDDDIMAVNRIEEQVSFLQNNESINVVGCSAMIIDDKNNIIRSSNMYEVKGAFIHPTVMARTKWYQSHLYNPEFRRSQDVELWLRSNVISCSTNLMRPLLFYREFGIQTLEKNLNAHRAVRKIYKNYKEYNKPYFWHIKGMMYTYLQDCIYVFFSLFGRIDYLMKRRKRKPLPETMCLNEDDLNRSLCSKS